MLLLWLVLYLWLLSIEFVVKLCMFVLDLKIVLDLVSIVVVFWCHIVLCVSSYKVGFSVSSSRLLLLLTSVAFLQFSIYNLGHALAVVCYV